MKLKDVVNEVVRVFKECSLYDYDDMTNSNITEEIKEELNEKNKET
jgi:hypothetical protein